MTVAGFSKHRNHCSQMSSRGDMYVKLDKRVAIHVGNLRNGLVQQLSVKFPGVITGTLASGNCHPVAQRAILHDLLDGQGESFRIAFRDNAAVTSITNYGTRRVGGDYRQAGSEGFVGGFSRALSQGGQHKDIGDGEFFLDLMSRNS